MHEDNVQLFQRAAGAINALDADAAVELAHPEIVFEPLRAATEGAFVGHEGVRRFIADTAEMFAVFTADYREFRELDGQRFLAAGSIRMRGRQSGAESDVATAAVVAVRDELIWRYKDYGDVGLALAAAAD
jgi:ketosteroid isomerase-like protein